VTGHEYSDLIASYILFRYGQRGAVVYREVSVGKSIIGKNRKLDILVLAGDDAYAIECKYQGSQGTAEEKIPYTLDDIAALQMGGCIAYAGDGFSPGVIHMLEASELAAYCLPAREDLAPTRSTRELDHLLAMHFRWWDILTAGKKPYAPG
jgi:hypothetical protein